MPPHRFEMALTSAQLQAAQQLLEAYADFWRHIRFRSGRATPPFRREHVEAQLRDAAGTVVRIQAYLDALRPGFKLRMVGGNARNYLHSLTKLPEDLNAFVSDIVHATFQDGTGYTESSKEQIDDFVREIQALKAQHASAGPPKPTSSGVVLSLKAPASESDAFNPFESNEASPVSESESFPNPFGSFPEHKTESWHWREASSHKLTTLSTHVASPIPVVEPPTELSPARAEESSVRTSEVENALAALDPFGNMPRRSSRTSSSNMSLAAASSPAPPAPPAAQQETALRMQWQHTHWQYAQWQQAHAQQLRSQQAYGYAQQQQQHYVQQYYAQHRQQQYYAHQHQQQYYVQQQQYAQQLSMQQAYQQRTAQHHYVQPGSVQPQHHQYYQQQVLIQQQRLQHQQQQQQQQQQHRSVMAREESDPWRRFPPHQGTDQQQPHNPKRRE